LVSTLIVYGALDTGLPVAVPSIKNWTLLTPTLSLAAAEKVAIELKGWLPGGKTATEGGVASVTTAVGADLIVMEP
jgi:hypothetical protein